MVHFAVGVTWQRFLFIATVHAAFNVPPGQVQFNFVTAINGQHISNESSSSPSSVIVIRDSSDNESDDMPTNGAATTTL